MSWNERSLQPPELSQEMAARNHIKLLRERSKLPMPTSRVELLREVAELDVLVQRARASLMSGFLDSLIRQEVPQQPPPVPIPELPPPIPAPKPAPKPPPWLPVFSREVVFKDVDLNKLKGVWELPEPEIIKGREKVTFTLQLPTPTAPSRLSRIFVETSPEPPQRDWYGHRYGEDTLTWGLPQPINTAGYTGQFLHGHVVSASIGRRGSKGLTMSPVELTMFNPTMETITVTMLALVFTNALVPLARTWAERQSLAISCCFCGARANTPCRSAQGPEATGREVHYVHAQRARTFTSLPSCNTHRGAPNGSHD